MNVIGAVLARNEASPDRYLERCIRNALSVCDGVVLLDDGSSDDTPKIARALGCDVIERSSAGFWGTNESAARAALWAAASERAEWVYIFDADHELLGCTREDMRVLCSAEYTDAWAFPLLDCWDSDETHRIDGFWIAWRSPRVWLARTSHDAEWGDRGIHSGHLPLNWSGVVTQAPAPMMIRHLSYVSPQHRARKVKQYLDLAART